MVHFCHGPSLWTSVYIIGLVWKLFACAGPMEHGPPGNKLGLAEEEEMNLFQSNTPIRIKSEVSDPEQTKLAEMTFSLSPLRELRPGQRPGKAHSWQQSEKHTFWTWFSAVKAASEIKAGGGKMSCSIPQLAPSALSQHYWCHVY